MKGVIIAGGTGSRLRPLTKVVNKNILPVYNKPVIYYPIQTFKEAGITDILIISGRGHAGQYLDLLGSGKDLGVNLAYDVQEEPGGIAQALGIAEYFADDGPIAAILADNIIEGSIKKAADNFREQKRGARILLKEVPDPERMGVAVVKDNKIVEIIEKPDPAPSNYAVTGIYFYDSQCWEVIKNLKPSARGELEITDLNNFYVQQGTMAYDILEGWWVDTGTFDSLLLANNLVAKREGSPVAK